VGLMNQAPTPDESGPRDINNGLTLDFSFDKS